MATQYDPIAKDESLNTTEATPRNIADVLAEELSGIASALTPAQLNSLADVTISSPSDGQTLKYDAVTQKWVNANDAGGHTIENPSGTDMTQRANLQFVDAHLTDDEGNDRTEVEIAKEVTEAAFDALNPQGTEYDGVYLMEVADAVPLTADMVGYAGGTVKGKLDELDGKVNRESVSVTADGVKNVGQLLTDLYALIDFSKISEKTSKFKRATTTNSYIAPITYVNSEDHLEFIGPAVLYNSELYVDIYSFKVQDNSINYKEMKISAGSTTLSDLSTAVPSAGEYWGIYY